MSIEQQKKSLRREIEQRRTELSAVERFYRSQLICKRAMEQILLPMRLKRDSVLLAYMPFRTEADITPLIEWGWKQGFDVALPKTSPDRQLSLRLVRGYEELESGMLGIREPVPSTPVLTNWSRIDLMIVPGLAFDRNCGRLGYGGGYYDRFLAELQLQSEGEPLKLALAFELQLVEEVPMEPHDYRVDRVLTESSYIC